jgi:hypothetical protein
MDTEPRKPNPPSLALIREAAERKLEIEEHWRAIGEWASGQETYARGSEHLAQAFKAMPADVKSEAERIRASARGYGRGSRLEKRGRCRRHRKAPCGCSACSESARLPLATSASSQKVENANSRAVPREAVGPF